MHTRKSALEDKFTFLLDFLADPAVIVNEKGHFLVNSAFEKVTGLSEKEVFGKSFLEVTLTAESKTVLFENLKRRLAGLPAEAHGGKTTVESVVRKGTTFTVTLPMEPKLEDGGEKE